MMFYRLVLGAFVLGLVVALAAWSWVVVDETQYVLITSFGRPVTLYGDEPGESGFHFKWPWQSALVIDRRLQVFDPPSREAITGDKQNLEVAPYIVWRVADAERFVRAAGTIEAAEARLAERVASALNDAISRRDLQALASTDAEVWQLDTVTDEVLASVADAARAELGVAVVDVRLRRFNYPIEVRPAIFELIRSERRQVAATLRAEGEAQYQQIVSEADRQRDAILAEADAEAERIRGQGEAEAARILNDAHARDPVFYEFVRTLETYRAILDENATIVLSSASPLLRLLTQGPSSELLNGSGRAITTSAESSENGRPSATPTVETGP